MSQSHGGPVSQHLLPAKPPPGSVWEHRGLFSPVPCPPRPPWCPLSPGVGMVLGLRPHTSTAWGATNGAPSPVTGFGGFLMAAACPEPSWCVLCNGGGRAQRPAALGHEGAFAGATRLRGLPGEHPGMGCSPPSWLISGSQQLRRGSADLPLGCGPPQLRRCCRLPPGSPPLPPPWHWGLNLPVQGSAGRRADGRAAGCPAKRSA